jgi:hypothetical protein
MKHASAPIHIYREVNAIGFLPNKRRQKIKILVQDAPHLHHITTHAASQAGLRRPVWYKNKNLIILHSYFIVTIGSICYTFTNKQETSGESCS